MYQKALKIPVYKFVKELSSFFVFLGVAPLHLGAIAYRKQPITVREAKTLQDEVKIQAFMPSGLDK